MIDKGKVFEPLEYVVLGFMVFILLWFLTVAVVAIGHTTPACLEHGYAESNTSLFLEEYCIRIEDGTQVVVPLSELEDER